MNVSVLNFCQPIMIIVTIIKAGIGHEDNGGRLLFPTYAKTNVIVISLHILHILLAIFPHPSKCYTPKPMSFSSPHISYIYLVGYISTTSKYYKPKPMSLSSPYISYIYCWPYFHICSLHFHHLV